MSVSVSVTAGSVLTSEGFVHFPAGLQVDNCSGGKMTEKPGGEEKNKLSDGWSTFSHSGGTQTGCGPVTAAPEKRTGPELSPVINPAKGGKTHCASASSEGQTLGKRADPVDELQLAVCR